MSYALIGARVLIGLVFAVSAVTKLRGRAAFTAFRASVADMRVVPGPLAGPVAAGVVATEAAIPVLLLAPATADAGLVLAVLLLAAFSAGIARVLATGTAASCRCFGVSAAPFGRHHLYRNGALALTAAAGLAWPASATDPAGSAIVAGVAAVAALTVVMLDDIVELFRSPAVRSPGSGR
ncbi:MauE/DoxX family redox-associated membrane protein [Actinoplanes philippinensis]|uniref:MauE/DoxX family redox-associated membrane protein n=1 Tax=Actinoplanes philippinensis TaxID=35752 RepID=UPI0033DB438B